MFATKVAKPANPQTKSAADLANSLAHRHPTPVLQRTIGNQAMLRSMTKRVCDAPAKALVKDAPPAPARSPETQAPPQHEDVVADPAGATPDGADKVATPQDARVTDAPAQTYIVPFDRHPSAAPGERIIFRGNFTDPSPASYQLEYSTTGGHFTSATGPATLTIAGLTSGNIDFFVPDPWDGTSTVQVVLKVKKIADGTIAQSETWNFALKAALPTTMTQKEGTGEVALPGVYTYDIGPAIPHRTAPFYEHQTILERFGNWSLNVVPADITAAYRTAHALNSAADVFQHFLGNYHGNNGTFTVNAQDQIFDQHSGAPDLSNLVTNLVAPKVIEVPLAQTYEAKPGTALGNFTITRIRKTDGTWKVKKG